MLAKPILFPNSNQGFPIKVKLFNKSKKSPKKSLKKNLGFGLPIRFLLGFLLSFFIENLQFSYAQSPEIARSSEIQGEVLKQSAKSELDIQPKSILADEFTAKSNQDQSNFKPSPSPNSTNQDQFSDNLKKTNQDNSAKKNADKNEDSSEMNKQKNAQDSISNSIDELFSSSRKINSLMFENKQISDINKAISAFRSGEEFFPDGYIAKDSVKNSQEAGAGKELELSYLHLNGILYFSPNNWTLWLNGKKYNSHKNDKKAEIYVKEVNKKSATFIWQMSLSKWKIITGSSESPKVENDMVVKQFTLQQNQSFNLATEKIAEGRIGNSIGNSGSSGNFGAGSSQNPSKGTSSDFLGNNKNDISTQPAIFNDPTGQIPSDNQFSNIPADSGSSPNQENVGQNLKSGIENKIRDINPFSGQN